jgi:dihydroorotate dehydrogenase subfamily 2
MRPLIVDVYETLLRPIAFALPAEAAHDAAKWVLRRPALAGLAARVTGASRAADPSLLALEVRGLALRTPIGLAPGFDKDGDLVEGLGALGFGFLEIGTVMLKPRSGNPKPRLHRYPDRRALVNCMGLPSRGLDYAVEALARSAPARLTPARVPTIVSFLGWSLEDYFQLFERLQPVSDAMELALRCPNTRDEPDFVSPDRFRHLLGGLVARKTRPLFVKLPNLEIELPKDQFRALIDIAMEHGVDGLVVSGTYPVEEPRISMKRGSIAGRPTFERTLNAARETFARTGPRVALIAQGGISTGRDAFEVIAAGASAVSVYSALVYRGPSVARRIGDELAALMRAAGIASPAALRGRGDAPASLPASAAQGWGTAVR